MDGHFVPNISFGAPVMNALNGKTSLPYDVHLMIEAPDQYIDSFVTPQTAYITVHQEACVHLHRTIQNIHAKGVKAGVAINPATPVSTLSCILEDVDLVLGIATPAVQSIAGETDTIPVVGTAVTDYTVAKLAKSDVGQSGGRRTEVHSGGAGQGQNWQSSSAREIFPSPSRSTEVLPWIMRKR